MTQRLGACLNHSKRLKKILRSAPGPGQMLNREIMDGRHEGGHDGNWEGRDRTSHLQAMTGCYIDNEHSVFEAGARA